MPFETTSAKTLVSAPTPPPARNPRLGEIISALSYALDLTEGQPMGHSINSCLIGMKIAKNLGFPERELYDLYFALLLKDTGCSSNAERMFEVFGGDDLKAKREVKLQDWTRVSVDGLRYLTRNMKAKKPGVGARDVHRANGAAARKARA